jgi:capsular exopolysaccharide synthesis family protein
VEGQRNKQLALLNQAQIRLANFKKANETFDLSTQSQALVTRMSAMQNEAEQARANKLAALAQLERLRRDVSGMPDSTKVPQTITRSPQVEAIKNQLTQLEIDLLKAQQEYTTNDPNITGLKTQIANLRRQLRNRVEFETSSYTNMPNAVKSGMMQRIAELQGEVLSNESRGVAVKRAMQNATAELRALPDREYRLGRLMQDATGLQQAYTLLNDQYLNLKIQEQAKVPNAQMRFPAEAASLVAPKKARILMLALPLGLMLAFLLAAFIERLDGRIHSDGEAERATGLPVIAHIPEAPREAESKLLSASTTQANFHLSESFQMLRTSIAFSVYDKPIRSILITSSLPGEGKSTCATNLAIAAAQSGESVILVDCDLRRPTCHRLLKLPNRVGFTNVVAGNASLDEALQQTSTPGLRLLASGPTPPNPYRLLHSRGARELLDQLRNEADFIVIDTPPALGMADAQVIATSTDAILLVVSTKGAKKHEISRTSYVLGQTNVELLGMILNRVESSYDGYYGQDTYRDYALPNTENNSDENGNGMMSAAQLNESEKA